jgi:hypothetical protein
MGGKKDIEELHPDPKMNDVEDGKTICIYIIIIVIDICYSLYFF